jgi:hypothetical protein
VEKGKEEEISSEGPSVGATREVFYNLILFSLFFFLSCARLLAL